MRMDELPQAETPRGSCADMSRICPGQPYPQGNNKCVSASPGPRAVPASLSLERMARSTQACSCHRCHTQVQVRAQSRARDPLNSILAAASSAARSKTRTFLRAGRTLRKQIAPQLVTMLGVKETCTVRNRSCVSEFFTAHICLGLRQDSVSCGEAERGWSHVSQDVF